MHKLVDLSQQLSQAVDIEDTLHFQWLKRRADKNHELRTTLREDAMKTVFFNYQAYDQATLSMFAMDLLDPTDLTSKFGSQHLFLQPASQLVFEVSDANLVKAFLNDVQVTTIGCSVGVDCPIASFVAAMQAKITIADIGSACLNVTSM